MINLCKYWLKLGVMVLLLAVLSFGFSPAVWAADRVSRLPAGNAITDGRALLRYALPIENAAVRDLQVNLEDISTQLRSSRRWGAVAKDASKAEGVLMRREPDLLASVPTERQPQAQSLLDAMKTEFSVLNGVIEDKDKEATRKEQSNLLNLVGQLEELMVTEFPFEVPAKYSNLPQLKGRATIAMTTNKGDLTLVVDGYNAPVTAGNFVDLVQRGFYNGLEFIRAEDFYILQAGDPPGKEEGFIDPATGKYRAIPLEFLIEGDEAPTYGVTLEDLGRYQDHTVLPFSAYGTVAMARPGDDPNGGSSQFFFFLFEPELTPAGFNVLDGRYAVFGYVVEGKEVLEKLKAGDRIESAKVVQGAENLVQPQKA